MKEKVAKTIDRFNEHLPEHPGIWRYNTFYREEVKNLIEEILKLDAECNRLTLQNCELRAHNDRLREGKLTQDELQNICHNLTPTNAKEYRVGCEAQQRMLFGDDYKKEAGDWGFLKNEPCRFCRNVSCVYFRVDNSATGVMGSQEVRCSKCGRDWIADSPNA